MVPIHYSDFRYPADAVDYWTIVGDNVSQDNFVLLNFTSYDPRNDFRLFYYLKNTAIYNDTDLCILPDNYGVELVAHIVAGELLYETEETGQSEKFLNE